LGLLGGLPTVPTWSGIAEPVTLRIAPVQVLENAPPNTRLTLAAPRLFVVAFYL